MAKDAYDMSNEPTGKTKPIVLLVNMTMAIILFVLIAIDVSPVFAGINWYQQYGIDHYWTSIASSTDGTKLAAIDYATGTIYTSTDSGASWTPRTSAGVRQWKSIISSSDGTKLAAIVSDGYIYTSTNSGATWTEQTSAGSCKWNSIASSADGTKLVVVRAGRVCTDSLCSNYDRYYYTSTNSGATWVQRKISKVWGREFTSVASSADGTKVVLAEEYGGIYTSTDSGLHWTEQPGYYAPWGTVASMVSSADGTKLAAIIYGGYIYTSTDSGATWGKESNAGERYWSSIASSSDGSKLIVADSRGYVYISSNSYPFWIQQAGAGFNAWTSVACSSDGTKLAAGAAFGYISTSTDSGATWTRQSTEAWTTITSSSDGTKMAAGMENGYIYMNYTSDRSTSWSKRTGAGSHNWTSIVASSDGTELFASAGGGYIYSSNDSGTTWTQQTVLGSRNWNCLASSSDGSKVAAAVYGDYIYTSTNYLDPSGSGQRNWTSLASASGGAKLAATVYDGYIYTSANSGVTWTARTTAGSRDWRSIASSSNGANLAATAYGGYVYTSADSGATWTARTTSGNRNWTSIASSSDGMKLAAAVENGYIYVSTDYGATWAAQTEAGIRDWSAIISSDDGTKLGAVVHGGGSSIWMGLDQGFALNVVRLGNGSGTITSTPAGIDCGSICQASYATATSITLTASSDPASVFSGWSGSCSGSAETCTLTMDANKNVAALFNNVATTIFLSPGWNFISFPRLPSGPAAVGTVLSDVSPGVRVMWGYDTQARQWLKYKPLSPNPTLTHLEFGKGYWLYMDASANINMGGWVSAPSTIVPLAETWNLIGYLKEEDTSSARALDAIAGKWDIAWSWNDGQWSGKHATIQTLPVSIQPLSNFSQGKAYWIKVRTGQATNWTQ
jgi:hypothetical protein